MTTRPWHRLSSLTLFFLVPLTPACQLFVEELPAASEVAEQQDASSPQDATDAPDARDASAVDVREENGDAKADTQGRDASKDAKDPSECDKDGDGHKAKGKCGGDDCDDEDPDVYPGQTAFFDVKNKRGNFDYDCDGQETPDPKQNIALNCGGMNVMNCEEKKEGFLDGMPKCGESGPWGTCTTAGMPPTCRSSVAAHPLLRCR